MPTELVIEGFSLSNETGSFEFKSSFNLSDESWLETIKDIVAISNSGGGVIFFGVDNNNKVSGYDSRIFEGIDPSHITDKIAKYTGIQFSFFNITFEEKGGNRIVALEISGSDYPIVFIRPGTYSVGNGRQKTAFSQHTVYFRHGAKSEPCNNDDLRTFIDKKTDEVRTRLLSTLQRVISMPEDHEVFIYPINHSPPEPTNEVRLVTNDSALPVRVIDYDQTHPLRTKDLMEEVKKQLPACVIFNQFDIQAIKKVYSIPEKEEFSHDPKYAAIQYSYLFVKWIMEQFENDNSFFEETRNEWKRIRRENRHG